MVDLQPGQELRRVRRHGHREAGVDGAHQEVHRGPHPEVGEEGGGQLRCGLGKIHKQSVELRMKMVKKERRKET